MVSVLPCVKLPVQLMTFGVPPSTSQLMVTDVKFNAPWFKMVNSGVKASPQISPFGSAMDATPASLSI